MKEFKSAKQQLLLSAALVMAILGFGFSTVIRTSNVNRAPHTASPLVPDTNVFLGIPTVKTKGLITFTTAIGHTYYMADSANKTGYVYLEAKAAMAIPY